MSRFIRFALLACLGLAMSLIQLADSKPVEASRRYDQRLPSLADSLSVAKSPLEPVTMALTLPEAANTDELALETTKMVADIEPAPSSLEPSVEEKRTTRSAESFFEQQSSSTTKGLNEASGLGGGETSTQSVVTESPEDSTSDASTETATEAATKTAEVELTTTPEPVSPAVSSVSQESTTTTTSSEPPSPNPPTTTTTTTTTAAEELTTTTKEPETTTTESTTTTTTTPAPTTTSTTTQAPTTEASTTVEVATAGPAVGENTDLKEGEPPKEALAESTPAPSTPKPSEPRPASNDKEGAATADVERELPASTSTAAPTPEEVTAPPAPSTTVSTTAAPAAEPKPKEEDRSSCNHLPTYDSDEIQKVFREETTFKNGTIKGKFTYINFDSRYRLVHYTRLPYGPVKIDRVEELGNPKQNRTNRTELASPNDIPNAVLQLRNLLPNSLFGFPFLGPNTGARAQSPFVGSRDVNGNDESNMYFYSTDSLATPNLFNQRVPVSLLPGQRIKPTGALSDSRNSFYNSGSGSRQQQLNFGMPNPQDDYSKQLNKFDEQHAAGRPEHETGSQQFQYSNPHASPGASADRGMVYSYYTTHTQQSPQAYPQQTYQPYPPRMFHQSLMTPSAVEPVNQPQVHHHHQPHSHEHYMAPFMFNQPAELQHQPQAAAGDSNNDPSRLRLKVKTSKALNVHQVGTKSAPLRLQPSNGHYSQLDSPAKLHHRNQQRQQQRLGKQSHQLKTSQTTNQTPVVYHVMRKPYNQQYDQGYAVAYDHDN